MWSEENVSLKTMMFNSGKILWHKIYHHFKIARLCFHENVLNGHFIKQTVKVPKNVPFNVLEVIIKDLHNCAMGFHEDPFTRCFYSQKVRIRFKIELRLLEKRNCAKLAGMKN